MTLRIRQAGFGDVEAIAACVAAVPEAHGPGETDLAGAATPWELWLNAGLYVWVVVDEAGEVVAVAAARPAEEVDAPQPLELRTLAVTEAARGSAVVDRLLEFCIGDVPAYTWVGQDPWLAAFLERHGFAADAMNAAGSLRHRDEPAALRRPAAGADPGRTRWSRSA